MQWPEAPAVRFAWRALLAGGRRLRIVLRAALAFERRGWRPVVLLPWIAAGAAAEQAGWASRQWRMRRRPPGSLRPAGGLRAAPLL
jgi:hypothetical protein